MTRPFWDSIILCSHIHILLQNLLDDLFLLYGLCFRCAMIFFENRMATTYPTLMVDSFLKSGNLELWQKCNIFNSIITDQSGHFRIKVPTPIIYFYVCLKCSPDRDGVFVCCDNSQLTSGKHYIFHEIRGGSGIGVVNFNKD